MKNNYLAKQTRQFKGLCKQIGKSWSVLSQQEQGSLLARFRRLYGSLKTAFARPQLRKMMGAAAFVLVAGTAQGQYFKDPVVNPFGLVDSNFVFLTPKFIDLDKDGDFDILTGATSATPGPSYGIFYYYENIGSPTSPAFAAPVGNPFGLGFMSSGGAALDIADLDDNGKIDLLLIAGYTGSVVLKKDINSNYPPQFTPSSAITIAPHPYLFRSNPAFVDIDSDGDKDLFTGSDGGKFFFYENTGTPSSPTMDTLVSDPFDIMDSDTAASSSPTFVDIDGDGDMDLFSGGIVGNYYYYENIGDSSNASFSTVVKNPFNIRVIDSYIGSSYPIFVDIDGDGDMDLFSSGERGFIFYENDTASDTSNIRYLKEEIPFQISPNPVSKELLLQFEELNNYHIRVMDLRGQVIESYFIQQDNSLQLPTQAWPTGLYLLEIRDEKGGVTTKKVVKK